MASLLVDLGAGYRHLQGLCGMWPSVEALSRKGTESQGLEALLSLLSDSSSSSSSSSPSVQRLPGGSMPKILVLVDFADKPNGIQETKKGERAIQGSEPSYRSDL